MIGSSKLVLTYKRKQLLSRSEPAHGNTEADLSTKLSTDNSLARPGKNEELSKECSSENLKADSRHIEGLATTKTLAYSHLLHVTRNDNEGTSRKEKDEPFQTDVSSEKILSNIKMHPHAYTEYGLGCKGLSCICNLVSFFQTGPTLVGILPYAGLKFYVYEELKRHVPEEQQNSIMIRLACGALAGLFGQTFTYPLDVVRRQMQVENMQTSVRQGDGRYKSTVEGLATIVRNQGWRQLFAGLSINYMKIVPSVAIGFTAYDVMKTWLRVPPRQKSQSVSVA